MKIDQGTDLAVTETPTTTNGNVGEPMVQNPKRSIIWRGSLEWSEKRKNSSDNRKYPRQMSCEVSTIVKTGELDLKPDSWPYKLVVQFVPKKVIYIIAGPYMKNSKRVLFHPRPGDALTSFTKFFNSGLAGIVHFVAEASEPTCNMKAIILLYAPDKKVYRGFIPDNQTVFRNRMRKGIQRLKTVHASINQGQSGISQTNVMAMEVDQVMQNVMLGANTQQISGPDVQILRQQNLLKIRQLRLLLEVAEQQEELYKSMMEKSKQQNSTVTQPQEMQQEQQLERSDANVMAENPQQQAQQQQQQDQQVSQQQQAQQEQQQQQQQVDQQQQMQQVAQQQQQQVQQVQQRAQQQQQNAQQQAFMVMRSQTLQNQTALQLAFSSFSQSVPSQVQQTVTTLQGSAGGPPLVQQLVLHNRLQGNFGGGNISGEPMVQNRERPTIWSGILEWLEKAKNPADNQKLTRQVPCLVSVNVKDGKPELNADSWPQKLIMQLMPKQVIGCIGGAYLKNSKSILFHPSACEALESLTKVMSTGFAGCVHFTSVAGIPKCDIKVLILLYTSDKKAFLGFIPNDQTAFVERLRKVIKYQKSFQALMKH